MSLYINMSLLLSNLKNFSINTLTLHLHSERACNTYIYANIHYLLVVFNIDINYKLLTNTHLLVYLDNLGRIYLSQNV